MRLPQEARNLLAPYFPGFDLEELCIFEGIPWYVLSRPEGYADRNNIYLLPGLYQVGSIDGLALLAHEIEHCRQYRELGTWHFRARYLSAYFKNRLRGMSRRDAYLNISFEIEAREIEKQVYLSLKRSRSDHLIELLQNYPRGL
jgi:Domain of unknown function (DUF4157)